MAREHCLFIDESNIHDQLAEIQARLIDLGSHIATPRTSVKLGDDKKVTHTEFDAANTDNLESWIDKMEEELPALTNFILPSGGLASVSSILQEQ